MRKSDFLLQANDLRSLYIDRNLIGFPEAARTMLQPKPPAPLALVAPSSQSGAIKRDPGPARKENQLQRVECLVVCAIMAALCKSNRSVIPLSMESTRNSLGKRFEESGFPMFDGLDDKTAGRIGYVSGTIAGQAMWPFYSPRAGKAAVSSFTATLICNLWLEDRLYVDRLQPDGGIRPDLTLDEDSIFSEGTRFEAAWADFNELVLSLPNCPFHDEDEFARVKRTASKRADIMHADLQARGLFLSKEIPN